MKRHIQQQVKEYLLKAQEGTAEPLKDFKIRLIERYGVGDAVIRKAFEVYGLTITETDEIQKV
jgi:hypothetical protein